ncbi:MAG: hypothetical protein R3C28_04210 [Pirellulaceae bacterium]
MVKIHDATIDDVVNVSEFVSALSVVHIAPSLDDDGLECCFDNPANTRRLDAPLRTRTKRNIGRSTGSATDSNN